MYIVLAWFTDGTVRPEVLDLARRRFDDAVPALVAPSYARHEAGGDDWGLVVLHHRKPSAFRWPVLARADDVTAVSLGLPVGLDVAAGPLGLARRLLSGGVVHDAAVPPFGLLAVGADRFAAQQDWLGMCRLFTGDRGGVTAFCSRPSLLATFLDGTPRPDLDGWAAYAVCGSFGAGTAPVRGVRLLDPGERVAGRRRIGGGWDLDRRSGYGVDDLVVAGLAARARPAGAATAAALDLAADGFASTLSTLRELYPEEIVLGLSGGKDSRLVAASVIASGWLPRLQTNEDLPAEGQVARQLVEILAESRGLAPAHRVFRAGAPASVTSTGLQERAERLHRRYDYQFPSTYTVRPAVSPVLPDTAGQVNLSGAGGELATGYWYAKSGGGADRAAAERALNGHLFTALPAAAVDPVVRHAEAGRIGGVLDHAEALGLTGLDLVDYVYLVERVRRWYTSAYSYGTVTPFLSPAFVTASFAVPPEQKSARLLHTGLLERYLPEWTAVPYVGGGGGAGPSTATRIWHGDGVTALCDLLDTVSGDLAGLVARDAVERSLARCVAGVPGWAEQKVLQQFASLAVASRTLEPDAVRPACGEAHARVVKLAGQRKVTRSRLASRPVPAPVGALAARLSFVKRSRAGRWVWGALRRRVVGQQGGR